MEKGKWKVSRKSSPVSKTNLCQIKTTKSVLMPLSLQARVGNFRFQATRGTPVAAIFYILLPSKLHINFTKSCFSYNFFVQPFFFFQYLQINVLKNDMNMPLQTAQSWQQTHLFSESITWNLISQFYLTHCSNHMMLHPT